MAPCPPPRRYLPPPGADFGSRTNPSCGTPGRHSPSGNSSPGREARDFSSAMICFTSFPLCRWLVNSRTRSRSFFVAFGLGHRCIKCHRGLRWMLLLFRIVHPRNTKLSLPRLKSTNRVFAGCSLRPSRSITARSIRLKDRLDHQLRRHLHHSIPHRRDDHRKLHLSPCLCWDGLRSGIRFIRRAGIVTRYSRSDECRAWTH